MSDLFDRMDAAHTAVSDVRDMSALMRDLASAAAPDAAPSITAQGLAVMLAYQCERCDIALQALSAVNGTLFRPAAP